MLLGGGGVGGGSGGGGGGISPGPEDKNRTSFGELVG